jgi:hypothetical protein
MGRGILKTVGNSARCLRKKLKKHTSSWYCSQRQYHQKSHLHATYQRCEITVLLHRPLQQMLTNSIPRHVHCFLQQNYNTFEQIIPHISFTFPLYVCVHFTERSVFPTQRFATCLTGTCDAEWLTLHIVSAGRTRSIWILSYLWTVWRIRSCEEGWSSKMANLTCPTTTEPPM